MKDFDAKLLFEAQEIIERNVRMVTDDIKGSTNPLMPIMALLCTWHLVLDMLELDDQQLIDLVETSKAFAEVIYRRIDLNDRADISAAFEEKETT